MRSNARRFSPYGRAVFALLLLATMLVAPIGLRSVAAQDLSIQTRVKILHASPDLGKCEVHINYDEVKDEFKYGDESDWIEFEPGAVRFTVTADRAGFNYAVFDGVYPVQAGNDYYAVLTDALVLTGVFDRSNIPDGGARVQIVQGSVDLPAVDISASGKRVDFATKLNYGRTSEAITVPAGSYDIEVKLSDSGEVAFTMPGLNLEGNKTYALVIIGEPNNEDHPLEMRPLSTTTLEAATPTA